MVGPGPTWPPSHAVPPPWRGPPHDRSPFEFLLRTRSLSFPIIYNIPHTPCAPLPAQVCWLIWPTIYWHVSVFEIVLWRSKKKKERQLAVLFNGRLKKKILYFHQAVWVITQVQINLTALRKDHQFIWDRQI